MEAGSPTPPGSRRPGESVDERQITHLICARLKYDLYDFFMAVLGLLPVLFLVYCWHQKHYIQKNIGKLICVM